MSTATNLRRFEVSESFADFTVLVEADFAKLTVERAAEINRFWGNAQSRILAEGGDVRRTVIRSFGAMAIRHFLSSNGASFGENSGARSIWNAELHDVEGWGGVDGTPHGWCGLRIVSADCETPGFDDVTLTEVSP